MAWARLANVHIFRAVVALALWSGCLSEPPPDRAGDGSPGQPGGDGGAMGDGGQTLPPPGELPVDGPVLAIAEDFDNDLDTDLVFMDRDGTRLVFLAAAEDFSRARHITLDFEVKSLALLALPGDLTASLVAVTREEDGAMLVRVLANDGEGMFAPTISCTPLGAPTLGATSTARIGIGHVAGQQRIGLLADANSWLSDAFDGESCPEGWPSFQGNTAAPALLVERIAGALTYTNRNSVLFVDGVDDPSVTSPDDLQAAEVVGIGGGTTPTVFTAGPAGLLTFDKQKYQVRDDRSFANARAMAAGDFDADDVDDLILLVDSDSGSRVVGYRSIVLTASSMNTEQCATDQGGLSCEMVLDEAMTFAVSGNFAGGDGAALVIDADGRYRCLTMIGGTLELCP